MYNVSDMAHAVLPLNDMACPVLFTRIVWKSPLRNGTWSMILFSNKKNPGKLVFSIDIARKLQILHPKKDIP